MKKETKSYQNRQKLDTFLIQRKKLDKKIKIQIKQIRDVCKHTHVAGAKHGLKFCLLCGSLEESQLQSPIKEYISTGTMYSDAYDMNTPLDEMLVLLNEKDKEKI